MNIIEEILRLPDMTGVIKARKRPVLLYGMGNGAELTDAYLRSRGIIDALRAAGAKEGDTVAICDMEFDFVE